MVLGIAEGWRRGPHIDNPPLDPHEVNAIVRDLLAKAQPGLYPWADLTLMSTGMRIAGGTDEVMRNILGERVLGLPKEPPVPA